MVNIDSRQKQLITVISMVLLAAYNITTPIDLKGMIPNFITPTIMTLTAFVVLLGAWWVARSATK